MRSSLFAIAFGLSACGARAPVSDGGLCTETKSLDFTADLPVPGDEAYLCFGFAAAPFADRTLRGLTIAAPASAPLVYHHITLFAVAGPFEDGPCEAMPDGAVELDVWAPGGAPLVLPEGVALRIPPGTQRLVAQAHVLRFTSSAT